jgi:hypothetical protein
MFQMADEQKPNEVVNPAKDTDRVRFADLDDIKSLLSSLYMVLARTYTDAGGELNPYILESYLPGRAFEVANMCGLLSLSDGPIAIPWRDWANGDICGWCVNKEFETEFFKLLEPALTAVRRIAEANAAAEWQHPTPAELVSTFLDEMRWKKARLIERMADKQPHCSGPVEAAKKQLKAIVDEPVSPNFVKDYHRVLCEVMRENSPNCSKLEPLHLVWRYQG